MNDAPAAFRARISEHNWNAFFAAILSFFAALACWAALYALTLVLTLILSTVSEGGRNSEIPSWFHPASLIAAVILLCWGALDDWVTRYHGASDRSVLGWHLLPDVLLMAPRLTFAVWNHLTAHIHLSRADRLEAFELLQEIHSPHKSTISSLSQQFDATTLPRLLLALQLAGWIDLHRGNEDWFYTIRSDQAMEVNNMIRKMPPALPW